MRTAQGPTTGEGAPGLRAGLKPAGGQIIWILGDDKRPRPVSVKLGITDGSFSEMIEGDLKEGQGVITGIVSTAGPQAQPFGQRGPRF